MALDDYRHKPESIEAGKLIAFAWPGGYSVRYLCKDGDNVCAKCAREADADPDVWDGERPTEGYIHWEGADDTCAHCNEPMPSEYGDPEAN